VNVAARLEALAEPGGICVSRVVRDQVRDKLAFAFEDMGEQSVKNGRKRFFGTKARQMSRAERRALVEREDAYHSQQR
jgi:class 3 adenylate cyclase